MRFAYLITSYNNFRLLAEIVSLLDDERNDIFIHFDIKVKELPELHVNHSGLFLTGKRIDVRWGTSSQIDAYYELFRECRIHGQYDFYHIVSGTTLPLKSQDFIHSYFEEKVGCSVFRFWPADELAADFKMRRIHFWIGNYQSSSSWLRYLSQRFWTLNMRVQKLFGIRINRKEQYIQTDCWASLSNKAVEYMLIHERNIKKRYRYSFAGDEFYLASELVKDKSNVLIDNPNLLYRDFGNAHPHPLDREDYERLKSSDYIFARKFSDEVV